MAFIEEDSSEDEGELLGLGLMDEGEDDEGGAWSDFDALNSTRFAYEIVEGAWFGLLALPGEGMDAWPVTYSDVSEGRTVVAAVDFAHLMHAWFVEGNGVAPALADAPRGVAKAVIGAAADAFGFDRRAAIRAWKRGYLSEAKVAEHKRLKKLSEDEALAAILEGAEAERRASGAASAERSPAWREDLETLLVHPAG